MGQYINILFYLGAVQGFLLSVFLFTIKANKISNKLLGLLTLIWGLILLQFPMQADGLYRQYPHLLKTISQLLFAFFPLLYLHVKYLLSKYTKFRKIDLLHFLPLVINTLLWMDFYLKSGELKLQIIGAKPLYYKIIQIAGDEFIAIQGIIYSVLALGLLSIYKQRIKNYQSNTDKAIIKVLYSGILLSLFAWIIGTIGINLQLFHIDIHFDLYVIVYLILVVIIYIISYVAVKTPEVFKLDKEQIRVVFMKPDGEGIDSRQNGKSILIGDETIAQDKIDEKVSEEIRSFNEELVEHMESQKPFLNPELSLQDLSDHIGLTRHQLSLVINQIHGINFYEFVNQYRINEVKQLMTDPSNYNFKLLSLAYDAGFNSKASFNRIFKQQTNMTPSQYFELNRAV